MRLAGTAQSEILYSYSVQNGYICEMQKLADGTIISQTTSNGFGETVVQALPNTQGGFICTRSEYNARGQLVKQYRDTGAGTDAMAATLYEYNAMGHLTRETLALAEDTTVENSPVTEWTYGAESTAERWINRRNCFFVLDCRINLLTTVLLCVVVLVGRYYRQLWKHIRMTTISW